MPFRLRHVCLALPLPLVTSGWLECQAEFGEAPGKGRKGRAVAPQPPPERPGERGLPRLGARILDLRHTFEFLSTGASLVRLQLEDFQWLKGVDPDLRTGFNALLQGRLGKSCCMAVDDVLSRSWELQVASERLRLLQTQRSALVEELLALKPAAGVLCNRNVVDSHAWHRKKASKFELQELWRRFFAQRKVLVILGDDFSAKDLERLRTLTAAASSAARYVTLEELRDGVAGRGEPVHCHCTCEYSVWVELLKGLVWISIALFFYTQRVIGWLWERRWPCVLTSDPSHERPVVGEAAEVIHFSSEGSRVFICYDLPPPALWHERYILSACACGRGWHIVLTPDRDVFPELISLENEDIAGYRLGDGIQLPVGLTGDNTYRFRNLPGPDEMAQLLRDARHAGLALAFPPGAGGALAAPAAGVQAPAQPVDDGSKWVIVETGDDRRRGDEVTLDGTEILRDTVGLKQAVGNWYAIRKLPSNDLTLYPGREASADARLLGLTFAGTTREERQWRDVAKESHEEKIEDSWGVQEHDNLSKIIDRLGRYDGLDLANIAGAELIFRRLQLIEYFYSEKGPGGGKGSGKGEKKDKKSDDGNYKAEAAVFAGSHREFGDTMVAPELLDYVSKEIEKDASVMKQVRKAREERQAAAK
ncbi:unnamed protein product [Cladocopium goreaui]|uniref:Uncharacterized protein n=1 Tax=Cladocopium goreaui TaxID=2562237 RepID=A0A9P1CYL5_9DINO|nr:unnamed protein product [Cladocopium goreaui]